MSAKKLYYAKYVFIIYKVGVYSMVTRFLCYLKYLFNVCRVVAFDMQSMY